MDLKHYIAESERQYHYRIKSIAPIDDAALDRIENSVMKYRPLEMSQPKKTMLQAHPLDFHEVTGAEVFIIDLVTSLPASSYVLQQEIQQALNCAEKYIVVRGDNEPMEIEGERLAAVREIDDEAKAKDLRPKALMATDFGEDPEGDGGRYYGDGYNARLKDYLAKIERERPTMASDPPNPLFRWLDLPKDRLADGDAFNSSIPDAPRVYSTTRRRVTDPARNTSVQGNYDDDARTYSKKYLTKTGRTKVISRSVGGLRGEQ